MEMNENKHRSSVEFARTFKSGDKIILEVKHSSFILKNIVGINLRHEYTPSKSKYYHGENISYIDIHAGCSKTSNIIPKDFNAVEVYEYIRSLVFKENKRNKCFSCEGKGYTEICLTSMPPQYRKEECINCNGTGYA